MVRKILIFFVFLSFHSLAAKKYEELTVYYESLDNSDDLIEAVYYNSKGVSLPSNSKVKYVSNDNKPELDLIQKHIMKANPTKNSLIFNRYGIANKKATDLLIKAKNRKLKRVIAVIDLNRAIDINHSKWGIDNDGKKVPYISIEEGLRKNWIKFKSGIMDDGIQKLLENGFGINGTSQYEIMSPPIYYTNQGIIIDIMHLKQLFLITDDEVQMTISTTNMSEMAKRINSTTVFKREKLIADPNSDDLLKSSKLTDADLNFSSYNLWHAEEMIKTFSKGLRYRDIIEPIPSANKNSYMNIRSTNFIFDKGRIRSNYTLGRYNSNDRITHRLLQRGQDIKEILKLGFLTTNSSYFKAQIATLHKYPDIIISGVVDQKFLGIHAFGTEGGLVGNPILRGNLASGYTIPDIVPPHDYIDNYSNIQQKVYFKLFDSPHRGINLYPYVEHLLHTKQTLILYKDGTTELFDGSFNTSAHYESTEDLNQFMHDASSQLIKDQVAYVRGIVKNLNKNLVDINTALFMKTIAYTVGLGFDHVTIPVGKKLQKLAREGKFTSFVNELKKFRDISRRHMHSLERISEFKVAGDPTVDTTLFDKRIEALELAIKEYKNVSKKYKVPSEIWISRFLEAMSNPYIDTLTVKKIIVQMFYQLSHKKELTPTERKVINRGLAKKFWDIMFPALVERERLFNKLNSNNEARARLSSTSGYYKYLSPYSQRQLTKKGEPIFPSKFVTNSLRESMVSLEFTDKDCAKLLRLADPMPSDLNTSFLVE